MERGEKGLVFSWIFRGMFFSALSALFMGAFCGCAFVPDSEDCVVERDPQGDGASFDLGTGIFGIEAGGLKVECNLKASTVSISRNGCEFVRNVKFDEPLTDRIRIASVEDAVWGEGHAMFLFHPSGDVDTIMLFKSLPFAVFVRSVVNGKKEKAVLRSSTPYSFVLDVAGAEPAKLCLSGTGGLEVLGKKEVGSYAYMALADPATRGGAVAGWITSDRGSGLVFCGLKDGAPEFDARLDYGGLVLESEGQTRSEMFVIGCFDDARLGLERYADAVAAANGVKLKPTPAVYCSWYHLYRGVREETFSPNAALAARLLGPYGLSVAQVDDGWQNGAFKRGTPKKIFLEANSKFPDGMEKVAGKVVKTGLTAGLWYMPFAGDADDPWFADKQSFFVFKDGKPYNAKWGGNPFDLSNEKVLEHIGNMASTICGSWGYKYIKIDGLWTGMAARQKYVNTGYSPDAFGEAPLSNPEISRVEAYRNGLRAVRKGAGEDVYILGCNAPQNMRTLAGSFGLVDGMRIGPDNGPYPKILCGPVFGGRFYFFHRRVWNNDPDPVYVRPSIPMGDARMICSWCAVSGQMLTFSEDLKKLPADRLELLRRTIPSHTLKPRPADYFSTPCPRVWTLKKGEGASARYVVGYFNWGNPYVKPKNPPKRWRKCPGHIKVEPCPKDFSYDLKWIGVGSGKVGEFVGYEYWTGKFLAPFSGKLDCEVPARDARVVSLRPFAGHPVVVSTSRHITQGVIDMSKEEWSAPARALRGESLVVGDDAYEIRVVALDVDGKPMKCLFASVSKEDADAGVKIRALPQDGWKLRVLVVSPKSRAVRWELKF